VYDLNDLQVFAEVEAAMQNDAGSVELQQAVGRGQSLAREQRQAYIDARWEAHQQWRSAQDARATSRRYRLVLTALVAFGVGALLRRLRVVRPPVAAP
jgi:hypothetical protein